MKTQFVYATRKGFPTPLLGWKAVHNRFKASGVKTVLIAGAYSFRTPMRAIPVYVKEHESQMSRRPVDGCGTACVADTYKEMIRAGHPKVRILPAMVFPDKPKYER